MNQNIVLLLESLNSKTGGTASALELLGTLKKIGYNVHIGVLDTDPFFPLTKIKYLKFRKGSIKNIYYVPGYFVNAIQTINKSQSFKNTLWFQFLGIVRQPKKNIKKIIEIVHQFCYSRNIISFNNVIAKTNIVIQAAGLGSQEISYLRNISNASIVLNHAGSPEAFEKFWITPQHLAKDINPTLSHFTNFYLSYDKILFQAIEHARECADKHPKLNESVITILPTCNEVEILKAADQISPYNKSKIIIVNVGSILPRKAPHRSIEAFASIAADYPQSELHFVGGCYTRYKKYRSQLINQVKKQALENRVFFHGHRSDYLRFMVHANILIQSSEAEGVSRVLREAMFMKLPIVSFSISGTRDILENKKEALLAPEKDSIELGRMLATVIADRDVVYKLTNAAHKKYLKNHSNKVYYDNVRTEFNKILNNG